MKRQYCPLMSNDSKNVCQENECAWWDDDRDRCYVVSIGLSLDTISDITFETAYPSGKGR